MRPYLPQFLIAMCVIMLASCSRPAGTGKDTPVAQVDAATLPPGVKAVWDPAKAYREKSATRERVCLNGLWRWQPARNEQGLVTLGNPLTGDQAVPVGRWGFFKVPGCWPGVTNYMQKESQTIFAHPSWSSEDLTSLSTAWYQREITIPRQWAGRRIVLSAEYLNSLATFYIDGKALIRDGKNIGHIYFPGGEVDISSLCQPGQHVLSALVLAEPLWGVRLSYADSAAPKPATVGAVHRRGFCGDLYLIGEPIGARLSDVKIGTSYRNGEITVDCALQGLDADARYALKARILDQGKLVKAITGKPFSGAELIEGRMSLIEKWKAEKLWDTNTPQNKYQLELSLMDADGHALDVALPETFGYREMWIEGRDFHLNGSRIFLSTIPLASPEVSAATATYAAAKETMERMKSFGINFVYTGPFSCSPGIHLGYSEILRAADDVGMLIAFTQPHMGEYEDDWKKPAANDAQSDYARHAAFYVRMAENHPSIVCYSMNHNAGGYGDDMDPDQIDGKSVRKGVQVTRLLRAEAIVKHMDPTRIVYHHAGGNLGALHAVNFYTNFTPIQEMSDWFGHWSTEGVKPLYLNEYAVPLGWDWTMYRGWYKSVRTFGSAVTPWEFSIAEWNAQFMGDRAFKISEYEKINLRWEGEQCKDKDRLSTGWHRWDYPYPPGSGKFSEVSSVMGQYYSDNFRAYRTWGVSGISPWSYSDLWKARDGVDVSRKQLTVEWENLQRPGFSPDFIHERCDVYPLAFERSDWIPTEAGKAVLRTNMPLLAYIAGKGAAFTGKDHNFIPGEPIEKQLIIINNSRETVSCECTWSLDLPQASSGAKTVTVTTGEQERIPLHFDIPTGTAPGNHVLTASVRFSSGQIQKDSFPIHVLASPKTLSVNGKIALFDPKGESASWLTGAGVAFTSVDADADLSAYDTLIVGKAAMTIDGPAPDIARVRDGLKVILFEQTAEVLEKRFGFRVVEYGLRNVFRRVPDHPLLAGLAEEQLRDWRGEATLVPGQLPRTAGSKGTSPSSKWCDMTIPTVWRCGCRGNVASVLIEKPACGDFLALVDGGFSLQYSPLMEYHEGKGLVIFCQLDVTGRSESDPAAAALTRNMLEYASSWKPASMRKAFYAGEDVGEKHLGRSGVSVEPFKGEALAADQVLIVGPGGGQALANHASAIAAWLAEGGRLLSLGLDDTETNAFLPVKVGMQKAEHIATCFDPPAWTSGLAGVGPADVHCHSPRDLPLVTGGATIIGDGVLAKAGNVVFCQMVPWQFPYTCPQYQKRTFRRTSCLVTRLLANMGVAMSTPILERFHTPVEAAKPGMRWLDGLYLDRPEEWDHPYRFFRW